MVQNDQAQMIMSMLEINWKICVQAKSKQSADFCYYILKRSNITEDVKTKSSSFDDNKHDDNEHDDNSQKDLCQRKS